MDGFRGRFQRFKFHGCLLYGLPVFIGPEVVSGEDGGSHFVAVDHITSQQSKENFGRLKENLASERRPSGLLNRIAGDDAVRARHEFKPSCGKSDVQSALFVRVKSMEHQDVGHPFGLGDWSTGCQDGHNS